VAFFKFFLTAAWAGIITTDIFQWIAYRLFVGVTAAWAVDMAVRVIVIVLAVWTVNVRFLLHGAYSGM
jgi:uncharacterized membrane protein (Fun14 family)